MRTVDPAATSTASARHEPRSGGDLAALPTGARASIVDIDASDRVKRRLLEMGLIPGAAVSVLRKAPLGDPVVVEVQGYQLGLRRAQAAAVQVAELPGTDHADGPATPVAAEPTAGAPARLALLGNPNCGKTTVFNALTGLRQRVGNYPGVTVERRSGRCALGDGGSGTLIDLPGTYSLSPSSPDERCAVDVLRGQLPGEAALDAVVVVLDASNLPRNLLLWTQVADCGVPMVVALTMTDLAERRGHPVDPAALEAVLGVPVVPLVAHRGTGIDALRAALTRPRRPTARPWAPRGGLASAIADLAERLEATLPGHHDTLAAERLLTGADSLIDYAKNGDERTVTLVEQARRALPKAAGDPLTADVAARYRWIAAACAGCVGLTAAAGPQWSDRLDHVLVHRVWGLGIFAAVMYAVFYLVYVVADPFMGLAEDGVAALGTALFGGMPSGALKSLLLDGVLGGVGGVLVFVPQIAMLFLLIALLEQSGYLARGAFLLDRLLAGVGLHGRSFIPMLSSHACAIPGILATRSIPSAGDRLATMFVAPFMSCGARLPVYALLIGVFLAPHGAGIAAAALLGCYSLGILCAVAVALVLRRTALKEPPAAFLLELPSYKPPQPGQVARAVGRGAWLFVRKAGTVILTFSVVLWAALYYPRLGDERAAEIIAASPLDAERYAAASDAAEALDPNVDTATRTTALAARGCAPADLEAAAALDAEIAGAQIAGSLAGRAGKLIEPVISPMGYDWKIGIGLIGAFAAREVFVSTLGVTYAVGEEADEASAGLHAAMRRDTRADGSRVWTLPTVLSVLVFFVIAMQCISTVAVMRAEAGWRWALAQLAVMNALAFVAATAVYQIGTWLL